MEIPYISLMPREFEWDPRKAAKNRDDHGLGFEFAVRVFADPDCIEIDSSREIDRERRTKAIGEIEGRLFTVVFTMRGDLTRLISARRANAKEELSYDKGSLQA